MRNAFTIGMVSWLCSGFAIAQEATIEELCLSIKDKVVAVQNPIQVFREDVFSKDCAFRFSVKESASISIILEKHGSIGEASTEFKSSKKSFLGFEVVASGRKHPSRNRFQKIDPDAFWDGAVSYENDPRGDNWALLRRGKYLIKVFSRSFAAIKNTERLLREISFH